MTGSTPPFLMRMGCVQQVITYRAGGNEGICLQNPARGMQTVANFNPAVGDFLGLDDVLERTQAHTNLADLSSYVSAIQTSAGTELIFLPTNTPFALIKGGNFTLQQLIADGGVRYVPDAIVVAPTFNTPFTFRDCGLETAAMNRIAPGVGPQVLNNFNPLVGDKIELKWIANYTNLNPDLSNISTYITSSTANGNTTLYFSNAHSTPVAFAVLNGVTTNVAQIVSQGGFVFDPGRVPILAPVGQTTVCRPEGLETLQLGDVHGTLGAAQIQGFSLAQGDAIDVTFILEHNSLQADMANIQNYFSTVETGGNTQLWCNVNGGTGGTLEAVFQNTQFSLNDLLAHSALSGPSP